MKYTLKNLWSQGAGSRDSQKKLVTTFFGAKGDLDTALKVGMAVYDTVCIWFSEI